jgi:DNA-binding NarL/FixJ family response regulator
MVSLVAAGLKNREIASELDLVEQTVKNMLSGVYRKCGVRNRTELARLVRDIGLGAA